MVADGRFGTAYHEHGIFTTDIDLGTVTNYGSLSTGNYCQVTHEKRSHQTTGLFPLFQQRTQRGSSVAVATSSPRPQREVLIHGNYLSQRDIEICLGLDLASLADQPQVEDIRKLHEALKVVNDSKEDEFVS